MTYGPSWPGPACLSRPPPQLVSTPKQADPSAGWSSPPSADDSSSYIKLHYLINTYFLTLIMTEACAKFREYNDEDHTQPFLIEKVMLRLLREK